MRVREFLATQLGRPSGRFGKLVTSRFMNRTSGAINKLTVKSLRLEPDDRVLEVGFGGGGLIARLLPAPIGGHVSGADLSEDMVTLCSERFAEAIRDEQVDLACAGVEKLPYADGSFTKACAVNNIYFWQEPALALTELRRVLVGGGRLVVSFSPGEELQKFPFARHGFTYYEPEDVRALLGEAGFEGVELTPGRDVRGRFYCAGGVKPQ
jgi:ubiquinone/menaquinone biosynthesis C-methylase UbiE